MDVREFADFYDRYRAHCIRAGVEPLTLEAVRARLAEWRLPEYWGDTEWQETGNDGKQRKQITH